MKTDIRSFAAIAAALIGLAGCVSNPLNVRTGANYYEHGTQAEQSGNFTIAREDYWRAYVNAQVGNAGPVAQAYSIYEWARMTGYLGEYADAEKGFNLALEFIDKSNGKADDLRALALWELARLLHDTGQHAKAVPVYKRALTELEAKAVVKTDPIAYADFLDDYAESLRAAGFAVLADGISHTSAVVRERNKDAQAKFTARRYKT